jgi:hypothetical protein
MNEAAAELKRIAGRDPAAGLKAWEEARKRFESPDWTELADAQIRSLRKQVAELEAKKRLQPEDVVNLWVRTQKRYTWHRAEKGTPLFIDRPYVMGELPAPLQDALVLRTSNDDKGVKDSPFVRFELRREADVIVAVDPRKPPPTWTAGWVRLPEPLPMTDRALTLYRKRHLAGRVEIGAPEAPQLNNIAIFAAAPR